MTDYQWPRNRPGRKRWPRHVGVEPDDYPPVPTRNLAEAEEIAEAFESAVVGLTDSEATDELRASVPDWAATVAWGRIAHMIAFYIALERPGARDDQVFDVAEQFLGEIVPTGMIADWATAQAPVKKGEGRG